MSKKTSHHVTQFAINQIKIKVMVLTVPIITYPNFPKDIQIIHLN